MNTRITRLLAFCFLVCLACPLFSQEVCDNGVDDDGDGLIDLQDTDDCLCELSPVVESLFPNPSFEGFSPDEEGCASSQTGGLPDGPGQVDCLEGWIRASDGTTDSWNAFTYSGNPPFWPERIPQPLPSGSGVAGFWAGVQSPRDYDRRGNQRSFLREYFGSCLQARGGLSVDSTYRMTLQLGFAEESFFSVDNSDIDPATSARISSPPVANLAIYGIRECANIRFPGTECVENTPEAVGWVKITDFTVNGTPGSWTATEVDFTPQESFEALAIGADCSDNPIENRPAWRHYYFVDDIRINTTTVFEAGSQRLTTVSVEGESICDDNIRLTGTFYPDASYQWYKDSVAITGETDISLRLEPDFNIDGQYQLRSTFPEGCAISEPVTIQRPIIPENIVKDSFAICSGGPSIFIQPNTNFRAEYTWDDGSTERFRVIEEPGNYAVTISTPCDRTIEQYAVILEGEPTYDLLVDGPDCFSPGEPVSFRVESNWDIGFVFISALLSNGSSEFLGGFGNEGTLNNITSPNLFAVTFSPCGNEPDTLFFNLDENNIQFEDNSPSLSCLSNSVDLILTTDTDPGVTYEWFGPDGNLIMGENDLSLSVTEPGIYRIFSTFPDGCTDETEFVVPTANTTIDFAASVPSISCADPNGTISVTTTSTGAVNFQWIGPDGNPIPGGNGPDLSVSTAGTYTLVATYGASCEQRESYTVEFTDIDISFTAEPTTLTCETRTDLIEVATDFAGPIEYQWIGPDGNEISGATSLDLPVTEAGNYGLQATFPGGCSLTESFTVGFEDNFSVTIDDESSFCADIHALTANPSAGSAPYAFNWADASGMQLGAGSTLGDLPAGTYSLAITDAGGCEATAMVTLAPVDFLQLDSIAPLAECEEPGGRLRTFARGGTRPYIYGLLDETGTLSPEVVVPEAGTYAVVVEDANGCSVVSEPVVLTRPVDFELDLGPDRSILLGEAITVNGRVFPPEVPGLQLAWSSSTGDTLSCADCLTPTGVPTREGTFTLTATSAEGCTSTASFRVQVDSRVPVFFPSAFSPNNDGINDTYEVFPGAGVAAITYLRIYDRWGGLVFEQTPGQPGWDGTIGGTPANIGTFTYAAGVRLLDDQSLAYEGTFLLMR